VAGSDERFLVRLDRYSGWGWARLWRNGLPVVVLLAGLTAAGCSTSYQLGSLTDDKARTAQASASISETTGSITGTMPPESDLVFARAAASEVLGRGTKDASTAWENPQTGARGTVTPIADAYTQDGRLCRDFLASYVHGGTEAWLQGEACRAGRAGKWEVRKLTPWKRS
jgi:surface antigen